MGLLCRIIGHSPVRKLNAPKNGEVGRLCSRCGDHLPEDEF